MCDFSDVPAGVTIENSVGGNTTKTKKVAGELRLSARKTVDGREPGEKAFSFELLDSDGNVLQTKQNAPDGTVIFDALAFGKQDVGVKHDYKVREAANQDLVGYLMDSTVFDVSVTPADADDDGVLECAPLVTVGEKVVDSMAFDNKPETVRVSGSKAWNDANDQDGKRPASITVRLLRDGGEVGSQTVTAGSDWKWTFDNLPRYADDGHEYAYTVTEDAVPGYVTKVEGSNITNTLKPTTPDVPQSKKPDTPGKPTVPDMQKDGGPKAPAPKAPKRELPKRRFALPKTGDDSSALPVLALSVTGIGALAGSLYLGRKRS